MMYLPNLCRCCCCGGCKVFSCLPDWVPSRRRGRVRSTVTRSASKCACRLQAIYYSCTRARSAHALQH